MHIGYTAHLLVQCSESLAKIILLLKAHHLNSHPTKQLILILVAADQVALHQYYTLLLILNCRET